MMIKKTINVLLSHFGFRVERLRSIPREPIDVFDLAVRALTAGREDLFFLQIGANDGVDHDPINKYISHYHWRGLLVEPLPDRFRLLKENYREERQLSFENAAISHVNGEATLYLPTMIDRNEHASLYATFDKDLLERRYGVGRRFEQVRVPAITFQSLLHKHSVPNVDILQVDTEGYDLEVLKLFDVQTRQPILIRYEHVNLSKKDYYESQEYLLGCGYALAITEWDTIALLKDFNRIGEVRDNGIVK